MGLWKAVRNWLSDALTPAPAVQAGPLDTSPEPLPSEPKQAAGDGAELERAARAALLAGEASRAADLARQAVAADPSNLLAQHLLVRSLLASGDREAASAALADAKTQDGGLGLVSDTWLEGDP